MLRQLEGAIGPLKYWKAVASFFLISDTFIQYFSTQASQLPYIYIYTQKIQSDEQGSVRMEGNLPQSAASEWQSCTETKTSWREGTTGPPSTRVSVYVREVVCLCAAVRKAANALSLD